MDKDRRTWSNGTPFEYIGGSGVTVTIATSSRVVCRVRHRMLHGTISYRPSVRGSIPQLAGVEHITTFHMKSTVATCYILFLHLPPRRNISMHLRMLS